MFKRLFNEIGSIGGMTQVTNSSGTGTIAIASTATVYSKAFKLSYGTAFGIGYKAASSGTIDLKIELEQSWNGEPPTTEGSADTDFIVGESMSDINSALTDTTARIKLLSPVPATWARLKITGGATNDASTTLQAYIFQQEI